MPLPMFSFTFVALMVKAAAGCGGGGGGGAVLEGKESERRALEERKESRLEKRRSERR